MKNIKYRKGRIIVKKFTAQSSKMCLLIPELKKNILDINDPSFPSCPVENQESHESSLLLHEDDHKARNQGIIYL